MDEDGNPVPLGGEFPLEENEHFNKLPVNTQMSNIQVPTNVYNRGAEAGTRTTSCVPFRMPCNTINSLSLPVDPDILNGAYMSEALNDVFIDNFQKDPTLTWQYFGSSTGFFRLYPGVWHVSVTLPVFVSENFRRPLSAVSPFQAKTIRFYAATDDAGGCQSKRDDSVLAAMWLRVNSPLCAGVCVLVCVCV